MASPLSRRALVASGLGATLATACRGVLAAPAAREETPLVILRAQPATAPRRGPGEAAGQAAGYDGRIPGPTLSCPRGGLVNVRLFNALNRPTALHWHGVRVPNAMDGTPLTQASIAPGATFDYRFAARDAGTFWYRPGGPESPRDRGLHGLLIVHEEEPPQVDRDVALLFTDWPPAAGGPAGGFATVNSLSRLDIPVKANERLRLRLVNAAPARAFALRMERHRPMVMAIDGQPAEPFVARDARVALAPGNRVDLFVDMTLAPGSVSPLTVMMDGGEPPVLRFVYSDAAPVRAAPLAEPAPLPPNPLPEQMDFRGALRRDIVLGSTDARDNAPWWVPAWSADARPSPLFSARRGRTVMLAFINRSDAAEVLHLHGHCARLLDNLDDGWKPFWLDTVLVPPRETARIAFVADNPGKWLIERRTIGRPQAATAAWFEVT